ncbi:adenylate/guanylate cyclase domain-containing protein [Mycobacterium spongiae]|uniref:HAMP domain-containing protein n=1 Tax=Mycobacterium spongiae TaxID=886343 RepID=A0A975JW08_9MYCO|nr:adenylate/guanylate cyclase domain-containing protein [Mycobacterium spongiae]QUR66712.1 HAMP domain-containing protein [Mycobacterium spongiae]
MARRRSVSRQLGWVLERITRQSGRLPPSTPDFGSRLLGSSVESQRSRRRRMRFLIIVFVAVADLIGIAVVAVIVIVAVPEPSIFSDAPGWLTWGIAPAYATIALLVGSLWVRRRLSSAVGWSIEGHAPTRADQRNTLQAPWRLAGIHLVLWGVGTALLTTLYGLVNADFIPKFLFGIGFSGIVAATNCYLVTEFALRPAAARALEAGRPPRGLAAGLMGRIMMVWILGSGLPVLGIMLSSVFSLWRRIETRAQFVVGELILATIVLIVGFAMMWIVAWLTATPVRVVRAALERVQDGHLDTTLVVFDGTEFGELQRGFNAMAHGLRERERVRDLFGRHVGRRVAAYAEQHQIELGGEERHAAVLFVDVEGSTQIAASQPPMEVVNLLNRFFRVIVDEVDQHHGHLNKFVGDATLAVFGAPMRLNRPEDNALAAARAIARRLGEEVPECAAGLGVAAGTVVAGNLGTRERFEYTVIGDPVNEAARLSDLAKSTPARLLASEAAVTAAGHDERSRWQLGEEVVLRGRGTPTRLAAPTAEDFAGHD